MLKKKYNIYALYYLKTSPDNFLKLKVIHVKTSYSYGRNFPAKYIINNIT